MDEQKPNKKELKALNLFYNRFCDLYDEIVNDEFLSQDADIRFIKLREAFSIYKELLSYEPIKDYVVWMKKGEDLLLKGLLPML